MLDLGSGTGEHARFFAEKGFEVVGVDVSDAMMARALEGGTPAGVQFLKGDLIHVDTVVDGQFGAAVCLGNTIAHITERDSAGPDVRRPSARCCCPARRSSSRC